MARGSKKVLTYLVKRKAAAEGEKPQLVRGSVKQVEQHLVSGYTFDQATDFDLVELGKAGVEIVNVSAE